MSKRKRQRPHDAYKHAEHRAYMDALQNGQRPPRAVTFTDRKKQADRDACRRFRHDV